MDVPKSNPRGEDEERNHKSLVNPKFSAWWLELWPWHTFGGYGREGGDYNSIFLSLEMEDNSIEKTMGTLIPKGVFIGFPIGLEWLKPTKGLG